LSFVLAGQFAAGLALLVAGASWLVRGGAGIAAAFGVSPLLIGLTIVAYGTSAPEMAVSVQAAVNGSAAVSLGNVVGSNIFNVLFILGASALIVPLAVAHELLRRDVWVMIAASAATPALAWDGAIGRVEGAALVLGVVLYTLWLIREARRDPHPEQGVQAKRLGIPACSALILGGLAALVLGANWLVGAATEAARLFGVSELVIGLTVVAAGTSLPEVATSVTAALRGERDIAVGNVVGSNIFNILAVLGVAAISSPAGVAVDPAAMRFDIPVMIAAAVACLPIFFTGGRIDRWEGALFLAAYAAYAGWLYLDTSNHEGRHAFRDAMLWFALPLTALTLGVSLFQSLRRPNHGPV
jgi:cation:H+ antiporter